MCLSRTEKKMIETVSDKLKRFVDGGFIMPTKCRNVAIKDIRTINDHKNNLLDILTWKCNSNPGRIRILQNAICKDWKLIALECLGLDSLTLSAEDTQSLQHSTQLSDKSFQIFKNNFANLIQSNKSIKIFSSYHQQMDYRRQSSLRIHTGFTFEMMLDVKNPNLNNGQKCAWFPIYACQDKEAIAKLLDSHINNNIFMVHSVLNDEIWIHIGGDRQTDYGFSESITTLTCAYPMTGNNSIPTLLIPKDIQDDYKNLSRVYHQLENKLAQWESLAKSAVVISLMKYSLSRINPKTRQYKIESRFVRNMVISIDSSAQSKRSEIHMNSLNLSQQMDHKFENPHASSFDDYGIINEFMSNEGLIDIKYKSKVKKSQTWPYSYGMYNRI